MDYKVGDKVRILLGCNQFKAGTIMPKPSDWSNPGVSVKIDDDDWPLYYDLNEIELVKED
jgi:hypothetical protein